MLTLMLMLMSRCRDDSTLFQRSQMRRSQTILSKTLKNRQLPLSADKGNFFTTVFYDLSLWARFRCYSNYTIWCSGFGSWTQHEIETGSVVVEGMCCNFLVPGTQVKIPLLSTFFSFSGDSGFSFSHLSRVKITRYNAQVDCSDATYCMDYNV